jgi:predicted glycoside hydrolase/deacetylase ChbG (UPF0249 family)
MRSEPRTRLVVQGDDFGMCHAVNTGTVRAFTEGIVTQASTMVPCPWFPEAAHLAKEHGIPLGMHSTLTCEWDHLRWGPLTSGRTLRDADDPSTFVRTVPLAMEIDPDEALAELTAQAERLHAAGLTLTYVDVHMGMSQPAAYTAITQRHGVPFLYPGVATSLRFDSVKSLSDRPAAEKKDWLLGYLERRTEGTHLLVSHCADDDPELDAITRPDSSVHPWAREYRVSDLAVLTDPDVRAAVDRLGIELVSVSELSSG